MEAPRHEFKIGKLVVVGNRFDFRPETALMFGGKPGDLASVYLQYGYEEASNDKESLDLRFTVEIDGKKLGTRTTRIEDSPLVKDQQWGLLKHETSLNKKGTLKGRYTIEATYAKGGWTGRGKTATIPFLQTGEFTVNVR